MYLEMLTKLYIKEVVKLHEVSSSIISNRDLGFNSRFWKTLQKSLGSKLRMSSTYDLQTDG